MDALIKKYLIDEPNLEVNFTSKFKKEWLGPASKIAFSDAFRACHHGVGDESFYLALDNFRDTLMYDAETFQSQGNLERAKRCLTLFLGLSSKFAAKVMPYDHGYMEIENADAYLKRSEIHAALNKKAEAVSDAAACLLQDSESVETYYLLSQRLAEFGKRADSIKILIYALSNDLDDNHIININHFAKLFVKIVVGMANLPEEEVELRPLPSHLFWPRDVPIWQGIVEELAKNEEYNALGLITIGVCANMRTIHTPDIVFFRAANVPGVNFKFMNIGKMLKFLNTQDFHQWHLQMSEYMIKRGADVKTISNAFEKPLLIAMSALSLDAGAPSFLNLGFPDVPVMELDAQDTDFNTAFHVLLKRAERRQYKTIEILCRSLLAQGCLTSLLDKEGKMAHEYIPSSTSLYKKLSEATEQSWPELWKRLEKLRGIAKKEMLALHFDRANEIYQEGLVISRKFPDMIEETLKFLTNLSIVNDKIQNYDRALKYALESIRIDHNYLKGHHWAGTLYEKQGDLFKASEHFYMYYKGEESDKLKIPVLIRVLKFLPKLIDTPAFNVWIQIVGDPIVWPTVLEKMTCEKLWASLQMLILGPPYSDDGQGLCLNMPASMAKLRGIFEVVDDSAIHADRLVLALLQHDADIKTIALTPKDVMHEVVRFCALTNDTAVLRYVLGKMKGSGVYIWKNANGQTPLHKLCYITGKRVNMETKVKIAQMLCEFGLDSNAKDVDGKLAVDYAPVDSALRKFLKSPSGTQEKESLGGQSKKGTGTAEEKSGRPKKDAGPSNQQSSWQAIKDKGSEAYKSGKYRDALALYSSALNKRRSESGGGKAKNHEMAVLCGNKSECLLKLNRPHDALEQAQSCVGYDAQWFKGHLRVAKATSQMGYFEPAIEAFKNSYERVQETNIQVYTTRVYVLSEFIECLYVNTIERDRIHVCLKMILDDPDVLLELVMHLLKENKWDHAREAFGASCLAGNPRKRHDLDLKPICNPDMLKAHGPEWIAAFLLTAVKSTDRLKSLTFIEGDTYFHAIVHFLLILDCGNEVVISAILDEILKIVKDKNIRDVNGNTVLHFLAQVKANLRWRPLLAIKLHEFGVDVKALNKDGKQALDLCAKRDNVWKIFKHFLDTENEIEKRKNNRGASSKTPGQPTTNQRRPSSGPKPSKSDSNTGFDKETFETRQTDTNAKRSKPSASFTQPKETQQSYKRAFSRLPCDECERLMKEAEQCQKEDKQSKVLSNLANVVNNKKHGSDPRHVGLRNACLERLAAYLAVRGDEDIPKSLLQISSDGCRDLISLLVKRNRWRQVHFLVLAFKTKKGWESLKNFARQLPLSDFLSSESLVGQEEERLKIFDLLMDNGGEVTPDTSAELVKCAMTMGEFKVVLKLLERGADPAGVTLTIGDTPLHAALLVALEKDPGNFALFDKLTSSDGSGHRIFKDLDLKCQNENGDNLLHLAAKAPCSEHSIKAVEQLCYHQVAKNQKNRANQLPSDFLPDGNDPRAKLLMETSPLTSLGQSSSSLDSSGAKPKSSLVTSGGKAIQVLREEMKETLSKVEDSDFDIFAPIPDDDDEEDDTDENSSDEEDGNDKVEEDENVSGGSQDVSDDNNEDDLDVTSVEASAFDNLPWEVECTEDVWNILKARKERQVPDENAKKKNLRKERITDDLKRIIVKKIQDLASGQWRMSLTKRLKRLPSSLQLHYIKLPQGGYILWELAVTFSPRCSALMDEREAAASSSNSKMVSGSGRIYSEIIRVWSIASSHAGLKAAIGRIVKSHQNGKKCIVKKNLKCITSQGFSHSSISSRIPMRYEETDVMFSTSQQEESEDTTSLCPPASTGKTEYHILKFYNFSSNLVSAILKNIPVKIEFPFKVTDKEHELINLQTKAPLLLIGRSGTGKTTVCLYRLWAQFLGYWEQVGNDGPPILPKVLPALEGQEEDENEGNLEGKRTEDQSAQEKRAERSRTRDSEISENDSDEGRSFKLQDDDADDESDETEDEDDDVEEDDDNKEEESDSKIPQSERVEFHHIHQLFVTKNPKLCSEVKKSFHRLCHATDFTICQGREKETLPNTLEEIPESSFPLFLTSRQLLLMLDASADGDPFFERDENLGLKAVIPGWGTQREIFDDIPLEVDSSDDESGGAAAMPGHASYHRSMSGHGAKRGGARSKHKQNRRECTYDVFAREVWPAIKKKEVQCHPSLVWTEIMSFIKGSYEALHTDKGHLDEKQYLDIGRKRAPNFSADRSEVYKIFKGYASYRAKHFLFDEADFIFHIYERLKKMEHQQWVFHEIYVDEIQDFTQGELCLLINLSYDPNKMLLTGDTAQTIMRGIAFRFEDLRSLFYYAQKKSQCGDKKRAAIKLPKGYEQLKYNYRSHTGILSLASAVLNLLAEFFKDSFDVLDPDQGMFPGPLPVVIETCKPGDLAFLLSGNRRKTSHIEFGAHQAILVVNEEAKENLPQELRSGIILTIYESKGLEFDDILLYNFFKDSKATEEWRVVTSYLNSLKKTSGKETVTNYGKIDLDSDLLEGPGRPHPLTFDPNKHKVLNAEFKHLYTAVTRARVNVWVFDEDLKKRAPMFEYFKALKLVRCTQSGEDDETVDTDTFFAEESTPREWRKKGDIFMSQKLYAQALQCYSKAQSPDKQRLAQAHLSAQKASQMKEKDDVPLREIKTAYFRAGVEFVYCGILHHAAICFLNAREIGLAALAYEKCGEFEKAGQRYKDLQESVKASRCFKKCGLYQQAVKALDECKQYEMAIDCLNEYEAIIQELEEKDKEIPKVLIDNRPQTSLSENTLLKKLIDEHFRMNEEDSLKTTIKRLSNADEQVTYLCKYKFIKDAAYVLKNQGNYEEAVKMLMEENELEEALNYAELSLKKPLKAAVCLAMACEAHVKEDNKKVLSYCKDAKVVFKEIDDKQGIAQTTLLTGMVKNDPELLKTALKGFQTCSPANPIGALEVFKQFVDVSNSRHFHETEMKLAFQIIETGIMVVETLWKPRAKNTDAELAILMSYELQPNLPGETVSWTRRQVPLSILTRARVDPGRLKRPKAKPMIASEICSSLEKDVVSWIKLCEASLDESLTTRTKEDIMSSLDILCKKVMLELLVQDFLLEKSGEHITDMWKSTKDLIAFLPPSSHQLSHVPHDVIQQVVNKIRNNFMVRKQLCRYFKFLWDNPGRVGRGKSSDLMKERAKESDWLIQACFFAQLLDIRLDVEKEAINMENDLFLRGKTWLDKVSKYAIFAVWHEGEVKAVESLGRRFINSFKLLTGCNGGSVDLFEAFFPFTKLLGAFGKRGNDSLMPSFDHLLFWMEFYTMMSFCFLAEVYQRNSNKPRHFFVPRSYESVMNVVNMCKGRNTIDQAIANYRFNPRYRNLKVMLFQRQDFIVNLLTGCQRYSKISLIAMVEQLCKDNQHFVAERILVLSLVMLLNTPLQYLDQKHQMKIRDSLSLLYCPDGISNRLSSLIKSVRNLGSALEVEEVLVKFFASQPQGDCLNVASWNNHNKEKPLKLKDNYLPDAVKKILMVPYPEIAPQEQSNEPEPEMADDGEVERPDQDELERELQDRNQMRILEEGRKRAAEVIIRSLRLWLMKQSLRKRAFVQYERELLFKDIVLMDDFCGICNQTLRQDFDGPSMLSEDHNEATEELTPRQIHEQSQSHIQQNARFMDFKYLYITQVHDKFRNIERFLLKHQVLCSMDPDQPPKLNPPPYPVYDVGPIVNEFGMFFSIKMMQIAQRNWNFQLLMMSFTRLQHAFFTSYKSITSFFEDYQREVHYEASQSQPIQDNLSLEDQDLDPGDFAFNNSRMSRGYGPRNNLRKQYKKK